MPYIKLTPSKVVGYKLSWTDAKQALRIPIYPARDSDRIPATHSDPFPAICSDVMSARGGAFPAGQ